MEDHTFSVFFKASLSMLSSVHCTEQSTSLAKPDLIQEIERFEQKEHIEIAADNLENNINVLNKAFKNEIST